ncbi:MAG: hypothetical protein ACC657_04580 [Thiohalomonadales bacterium]
MNDVLVKLENIKKTFSIKKVEIHALCNSSFINDKNKYILIAEQQRAFFTREIAGKSTGNSSTNKMKAPIKLKTKLHA